MRGSSVGKFGESVVAMFVLISHTTSEDCT